VYRFVLRENIALFQNVLKVETAESVRHTIQGMLLSVRRELAILESNEFGVQDGPWPLSMTHGLLENGATVHRFRIQFGSSQIPYLALDPRPGLHIIDINEAYAHATMTTRAMVVGRLLFDVFPDNPDDPLADGVSNLYASLRAAVDSRRPNTMPIQRYDIRDVDGRFVERHWRQFNTPVFDAEGRLNYLLHHVEDVTEPRRTDRNQNLLMAKTTA
jgi:PAS domain-containing protein